jgi:hypothetical protein
VGVLLHNLVEQRTDAREFTEQAVLTLLEAASRTRASRDGSSSVAARPGPC